MSDAHLAAPVAAARQTFLELAAIMAAYGLDFQVLPLLLEWPPPVKHAYQAYQERLEGVAQAMAVSEGVEAARLSPADRDKWTKKAFEAVMDS